MTADELALVVELAVITEQRTTAEQEALLAVAREVDRDINRQSLLNPRMPDSYRRSPYGQTCTYSTEHDRECICGGSGKAVRPTGGWSRLEDMARRTHKAQT